MATQNNAVLGYIKCEAGGRATVHRTNRGQARYLYTRCDCCGCDQRTGAAVQTRLYNGTEWLNGAPDAPPNLITTEKQPQKAVVQPENEPQPQPKKEEWEPEKITAPEPKGNGGLGLVAVLGGGLAFMGFILSKVRA